MKNPKLNNLSAKYGKKYDFEIDAYSGAILDFDIDEFDGYDDYLIFLI